ncbi:UNVERIFIED_CONTAM: hypothetical protein Sradi_0690600 [Sesamum radiatum]|uniref:Uncharacterized protein n=1 Tax=Sesamum radiatum TaxID=300843 RepID=A0AAW2VS55_SESRA
MSKNPLIMILETNKFNGMSYNDWLRNLRIVLDFENQTYVLDKSLPVTLPEGSTLEERVMFGRHIRYAATKAFFGTKMTQGFSVRDHGIKMLFHVEKLEDLQTGLNNDTYIDLILQSLPPSYYPFIPSVLVGEASTSKAKGKGAKRWKRKKGKAKAATSALSALIAPVGMGKGKGKVLERSRKLSRDEVVLKLSDGKAVAAEAVGIVHLVVSDQVRI